MSNTDQKSVPTPTQVQRAINVAQGNRKRAAEALKLGTVAEVRRVVYTSES